MLLNKKKYCAFAKSAITICALSALVSYGMYASYSISVTSLLLSAGIVFLLRREQGNIAWWKAFVWGLSAFLLRGSIVWALKVFPLEDHDLVILTLQMPLDGFVMPFILEYLLKVNFFCLYCKKLYYFECSIYLEIRSYTVLKALLISTLSRFSCSAP